MSEHNIVDAAARPLYFTEETRAKLKRIKASSRRGCPAESIDWNSIWQILEREAQMRDQNVEQLVGWDLRPRDLLHELASILKKVDDLLEHIQDSRPLDWHFIGKDQISIRSKSPRAYRHLREELLAFRSELIADIEHLKELTQGRRTRARTLADCNHLFLAALLEIGHQLFGPGIGDEQSPLIKFVSLAAKPVLGKATPRRATLRTIARRL